MNPCLPALLKVGLLAEVGSIISESINKQGGALVTKPSVNTENAKNQSECFVIMPVDEPDGYTKSHFRHVFDDIVSPACQKAGFVAIRADQVKQSNLIHLDILQKILGAPMAVCDLSSRNPNVLFELALRQAFDKPVALIQEVGTPSIFDIAPLRYTEYRKERIYHEVLEDQHAISETIKETFESHNKGKGINSIVKLLSLSQPAKFLDRDTISESESIQQLILAELASLRDELRMSRRESEANVRRFVISDNRAKIEELVDRIRMIEMRLDNCDTDDDISGCMNMIADCQKRLLHITDKTNSENEIIKLMRLGEKLSSFETYIISKRLDRQEG